VLTASAGRQGKICCWYEHWSTKFISQVIRIRSQEVQPGALVSHSIWRSDVHERRQF
jgi:hypothetical protein